jgi:hypothetical protein
MGLFSKIFDLGTDIIKIPISLTDDLFEGDIENVSENLEKIEDDIYKLLGED